MIRVAIVEDEAAVREQLAGYVQRRFLVGIQLYHDSPPYWPHKKFKN